MNKDVKFLIIRHIFNYGPKTLSELSKTLKIPRQRLHYNLTQLVNDGVLIKYENKYYLQPLFEDENFSQFYLKIIYLMTEIADYIVISEDIDETVALLRNFEYLIKLNLDEMHEILKNLKKNQFSEASSSSSSKFSKKSNEQLS